MTTVVLDVISKKWIVDITSADEISTEVQAVFARALRAEALQDVIDEHNPDGVAWDPDSEETPVLLVMSDNGPQMTSGSTRESWPWHGSQPTTADPAPPPTKPGSSHCSGTSKPSNPTSNSESPWVLRRLVGFES